MLRSSFVCKCVVEGLFIAGSHAQVWSFVAFAAALLQLRLHSAREWCRKQGCNQPTSMKLCLYEILTYHFCFLNFVSRLHILTITKNHMFQVSIDFPVLFYFSTNFIYTSKHKMNTTIKKHFKGDKKHLGKGCCFNMCSTGWSARKHTN